MIDKNYPYLQKKEKEKKPQEEILLSSHPVVCFFFKFLSSSLLLCLCFFCFFILQGKNLVFKEFFSLFFISYFLLDLLQSELLGLRREAFKKKRVQKNKNKNSGE